jgi:putative acetyltransferase
LDALTRYVIARANPADPGPARLIHAHLANSDAVEGDSNNLTMGVEELSAATVKFWTISENDTLLGCGALKSLSDQLVEIKSMHVFEHARGKGIASELLKFLISEARANDVREMVLETGSMDAYAAARALYQRMGFTYCDPIPGHNEDPNSVYMRLALDPARH